MIEKVVGLRKYLLGVTLVLTGIGMSLKGDTSFGWKLIASGIAIVVGGNVYDHEREKKKKE